MRNLEKPYDESVASERRTPVSVQKVTYQKPFFVIGEDKRVPYPEKILERTKDGGYRIKQHLEDAIWDTTEIIPGCRALHTTSSYELQDIIKINPKVICQPGDEKEKGILYIHIRDDAVNPSICVGLEAHVKKRNIWVGFRGYGNDFGISGLIAGGSYGSLPALSRKHLKLKFGWWGTKKAYDLKSRTGVFINEKRILWQLERGRRKIVDGDVINLIPHEDGYLINIYVNEKPIYMNF